MALAAGTTLGPYEILAPIGAGGMGEVYRARDTRLNREVALKILPQKMAGDPSRRQRFEQEARAVAALNHPNIVALYDVGEGYIVSELVDGEPLRGVKLSMRKTLEMGAQIASGLAAAHDAGIVHRDLKPGNIMLTRDGRIKILDFGLAKVHATSAAAATETIDPLTEPGSVVGSVGYMSPEQVRGETVDHRSDIFNLGLILHELLAGRRVFHADTRVETMTAILKQDAPELPDAVPGPARQIVARCLEKQPVNRFQSAKDLAFALGQAASSEVLKQVPAPAGRKRLRLSIAAALAFIAATIFATRWLWDARPPARFNGLLLAQNAWIPSVSPDGRTLAYSAIVGDALELGIMKPESGDRAILTHERGKGYIQTSCWSRDGTHIFFDRSTDVPSGIYTISVLGGEERLLLENANNPESLADGSLLVTRINSRGRSQLYRFWPDTGKLRDLPLEFGLGYVVAAAYRAFPDGKRAIVNGVPVDANAGASRGLYLLDVESGSMRPFGRGQQQGRVWNLAITRDGQNVLIVTLAGNIMRVASVPASGKAEPVPLLALTNEVSGIDTGPDGAIYLSATERPAELLRFPPAGGRVEIIAGLTIPLWVENAAIENFAVLPDGRAVAPEATAGRFRLMIYQRGKDPVPLVNTDEQTLTPVAAAGGEVAFVMPPHTLATASVANGRITRKIPFEPGDISGLALAPDLATIYCAAGGFVWAVPTSGGEPRKIRAGNSVAIDPSGKALLIEVLDTARPHLIRVPLNGGPEQAVPESEGPRPAGPLLAGSLAGDGRIALPGSTSFWWNPAVIFDSTTGHARQLLLDYNTDLHSLTWAPDGQMMGIGYGLRSTIWKFQPEGR